MPIVLERWCAVMGFMPHKAKTKTGQNRSRSPAPISPKALLNDIIVAALSSSSSARQIGAPRPQGSLQASGSSERYRTNK